MTRRLVVTADDLGRDPGTTATVLDLIRAGHVMATTAVVVAPGAQEAVRAVRRLGVEPHLHVTLTSETGLDAWRRAGSSPLAPDDDGDLPADPRTLAAHAPPEAVADEMRAQLARLRSWGATPPAVDSHAGTLYGWHGRSPLPAALAWCASEGLALRLPRSPVGWVASRPELASAHAAAVALADRLQVRLPAVVLAHRRAGDEPGGYAALRAHVTSLLDLLPHGTSELVLHPADDVVGASPQARRVRSWEARLLRDPDWHAALQACDVRLVTSW